VFNKLLNGEKQDFWSVLSDFGKDTQSLINKVAPLTSKIAPKIATALTGVPIPDLSALANGDADATATAKDSAMKVLEKNKDKLMSILDQGVKGLTGAGAKKKKKQSGRGYTKADPMV